MVKINLIKERYIVPVQQRERLLFFIGVFLPLVLFSLAVLGIINSVNRTVIFNYSTRIEKQQQSQEEEERKALSPTSEERGWQGELKQIAAFQGKYLPVTPRLVALADAMPSRLYLNSIDYEGSTLTLAGEGPPGNQTMASLASLLERLNGNANFTAGFGEFRLEQTKSEEGVLNFSIIGVRQ